MNDLGLRLAWSALQTTLFGLAAAALYVLAARRRPASGAAVAAAGLGGVVVVTVFALWPPPTWWDWRSSFSASSLQRAAPGLADPPVADAPTASPPIAEGPAWTIHWVHGASEGLDRATAPFAGRPGIGWGIAAVILLCGIGFSLIRLALGLLGVFGLRRRSRPIEDPDLLASMNGCGAGGLPARRGPPGISGCRLPGRRRLAEAGGVAAGRLARLGRTRTSGRAGPRIGARPAVRLPARPVGPSRRRPALLPSAGPLAGRPAASATGTGRRRPGGAAGRRARTVPASVGPTGAASG